VEPLPRLTLAAAQLKNQRDEQQARSGGAWDPEESLLALKGHVPDHVLHQLAPFQRDAVKFIMSNKGRALVADEMGLGELYLKTAVLTWEVFNPNISPQTLQRSVPAVGKTRTAISAAMAYRDDWPVLVVCPSSARHHWQAELLAVLHPDFIEPRDISIVENNNHPVYKGPRDFKYKILIISYHLLSKVTDTLLEIPFNVVIVDESHYMKSATAQRTKCLIPLLHKSRRALLLSGTPALSRPIELFTQLHALAPKQWNDLKEYGRR
jgi:SWI/SNF-related matrix-associated actin-dependent regulator 1 of chromatin subfamily A